MKLITIVLMMVALLGGCASDWKIHGGPADCVKMCTNWGLEFTAMVGVGNQDRTGNGATACVCKPKHNKQISSTETIGSSITSLAAPITAAEIAAAQAAVMVQQQQQIQQRNNSYYR